MLRPSSNHRSDVSLSPGRNSQRLPEVSWDHHRQEAIDPLVSFSRLITGPPNRLDEETYDGSAEAMSTVTGGLMPLQLYEKSRRLAGSKSDGVDGGIDISFTISKDNSADDFVRNAKLLAEIGERSQRFRKGIAPESNGFNDRL